MLHADERLEEIILAALLVLCTTVMMVAEHGGLGRAGESGPLIRVGLDLIATGGTKPIPPKAQAPGSGAQMEGLATATLESPNPLVPTPSAPSAATTRLSSRDLGLLSAPVRTRQRELPIPPARLRARVGAIAQVGTGSSAIIHARQNLRIPCFWCNNRR